MIDGFTIVKGFFRPSTVAQAKQELDPWFDKGSLRYPYMDLHIGVPGKSQALDSMFEIVLTTPKTKEIIKSLAGWPIKFKDINARRMKARWNNGLKWHTDGEDEYGIGIPLTDIPWLGPATGFKSGTAYCKAGDLYFFINRFPHCRMRNWRLARSVVVLGSFFPIDKAFTKGFVPWPKDVVGRDLSKFRQALGLGD